MEMELATDLLRETVWTALLTSAPILFTALGTGLVISIFQAATQVNEQTLTFVPKILLTLTVFGLFFPFFAGTIVEFTRRMILAAGQVGP